MSSAMKPAVCRNCRTERRPVSKAWYCRKCYGWALKRKKEHRKTDPNVRRFQFLTRNLAILEERERGLREKEEVDAFQLE